MSRWYFGEIAGLLANLEDQAGHAATAAALCQEARTILAGIGAHIPPGELRHSFCGLPEVRAIYQEG